MSQHLKHVRAIVKNLFLRKGRTFLTILGIVIGVAGVIIIISLGAGAQSLVLGQITKLGTNLIGILPGASNKNGPPAAVFGVQITTLNMLDIEAIKQRVPAVNDISAIVQGNVTVIYGKESVDTNFTATEGSLPRIQNIELEQGTFFTDEEARAAANVVVLGYDVAEQLFPNGDSLGKIVKLRTSSTGESEVSIPFRVIGVQKKTGTVAFQNQDDKVFIPFIVGQRQLLGINYIQSVNVKAKDGSDIKSTIEDIETVLREEHNITNPDNDDFSVRDLADAIKILTSITDALRMFLGLMAGISLIVGGIGIMNIMLVTVSERTREIGLRKALGATPRQIRNQFLIEAVILTGVGGIVGILLGIFVSYVVSVGANLAGYDWAFVISPLAIILAVMVSTLTGIVFGLFPAFKAARLNPIEALRYE